MIEQGNGDPLIEYKLPGFINENKEIGDNPDDFEILQVLGHGAFSQVLKVRSKKNSGIYAMKKINITKIFRKYKKKKYFMNEVHLLKNLDHPNVIKCYKILKIKEGEEEFLYFIMEFLNNADLDSFNKGNFLFKTLIPEEKLWDIFYKCLSGLDYIHKKGIIHRDIKPSNLFLDDDFNIKIGDFNISAVMDEESARNFVLDSEDIEDLQNYYTKLGTGMYMAPEVQNRKKYDQKADIYSMGRAFYELCYGWRSIIDDEYNNKYKPKKEMEDFIEKMTDIDPKKRPTCQEALSEAKYNFIKSYLKNTSIKASFNCFNNFKNVNNYFSDVQIANFIFDGKKELSQMCFNLFSLMKNNNKNISLKENIQIEEGLYDLRLILEKEGLDVKSDNIEVDPGKFIIFFIKKLNCELNEKESNPNGDNKKKLSREEKDKEEINRFKLLIKSYHFAPEKKEYYFNLIINAYNKKILSFISRNFFSYIISRRTCINCGTSRCNFSRLFFIPINVDILKQKMKEKKKNIISLIDGFDSLKETCKNINKEKQLICKICDKISEYKETKNFYRTAKNLIIIFDRGENIENKTYIDFDENLTLNNLEAENINKINYQLVGIVEKVKDEYISFIKAGNIWISSQRDQISFNDAKKFGTVVALFYYSEDNNLSIENQEDINLASINLDDQIFVEKYHYKAGKNNNNSLIN